MFGAAQPGDQPALPGGHQPDGPEGLCPALSVPSGKEQLTCQEEEGEVVNTSWNDECIIVICLDDDIAVTFDDVDIVITSWYDDDDIVITSNDDIITSCHDDDSYILG